MRQRYMVPQIGSGKTVGRFNAAVTSAHDADRLTVECVCVQQIIGDLGRVLSGDPQLAWAAAPPDSEDHSRSPIFSPRRLHNEVAWVLRHAQDLFALVYHKSVDWIICC